MAIPLVPLLIVGIKALLINIVGLVVAYFIYKILMTYSSVLIEWGLTQLGGINPDSIVIKLTGIGAWAADVMMLQNTISLIISLMIVKFIIRMVRG